MQINKNSRLLSLDVMRGATVAAMTLVNNPGDWGHIYAPLEHSAWNGCTPTDLIFPFFLFMVGVSTVFAMEGKKADPANHGKMILGALRRMAVLILISWGIQLFYHHTPTLWQSLVHLRFPGVLPRIALVFFICSVFYIKCSQKTRDWVLAGVLIGYYVVMTFIPVPDGTPANLNPETNMGAWLDRLVFGTNHLWRESKTWDPEGLLSTLPAIGTGLMGIRVGTWLKRPDREQSVKVTWLFVYGILAVVVALVWDLFFPINKSLWTSTFVLYTGGMATIALAFTYWIIDMQGHKKHVWILVVFGMNAITGYILSGILQGIINFIPVTGTTACVWFYRYVIAPHFTPYNASLVRAIIYLFLTWLPMLWLYKKKIYIKV
jgi:predicted acyltransferase